MHPFSSQLLAYPDSESSRGSPTIPIHRCCESEIRRTPAAERCGRRAGAAAAPLPARVATAGSTSARPR